MSEEERLNCVMKTILENNNNIPQAKLNYILNYEDLHSLIETLKDDKYVHFFGAPDQPYFVTTKGIMFLKSNGYVGKKERENKIFENSNKSIKLSKKSICISITALSIAILALILNNWKSLKQLISELLQTR